VSPEVTIARLVWGTLVGLDLVSVPQMMIARPLVAGPVAGAMLGDIETGLKLGVVFELLQYDILPVGAVRYPEYGPATVGAVATAHAAAGVLGLGLGTLVGLITGMVGGVTIPLLRRVNGRMVQAAPPAPDEADPRAEAPAPPPRRRPRRGNPAPRRRTASASAPRATAARYGLSGPSAGRSRSSGSSATPTPSPNIRS